jgi:hypothetical protein
MPDAKSGRVHIRRHLAVPGGVAAEDTGNHFLLSLTRRSECCRSGSQISGAGLYERQRAKGRCRSVEGGWLFNGLKKGASRHAQPDGFALAVWIFQPGLFGLLPWPERL